MDKELYTLLEEFKEQYTKDMAKVREEIHAIRIQHIDDGEQLDQVIATMQHTNEMLNGITNMLIANS